MTREKYFTLGDQTGAEVNVLERTGNLSSGLESEPKKLSTDFDQSRGGLHRFNSLLDPNLAVYDLDTIDINPNFFLTFRVS